MRFFPSKQEVRQIRNSIPNLMQRMIIELLY